MNTFAGYICVFVALVTVENAVSFDSCDVGCLPGFTCNYNTNLCYETATCVDSDAIECATKSSFCTNPLYRDLMVQKCIRTCNFCGVPLLPLPPTKPCVDKLNAQGVNECPAKAFLCNNSLYLTLMTQQCPKTCKRCPASG